MAAMLVGKSSAVAAAKWSRKPGPMSVPKAAWPSTGGSATSRE
jgi:hypothetical protein